MEPQIGIRGRATLDPGYRFVAFQWSPRLVSGEAGDGKCFRPFSISFRQMEPQIGIRGKSKNCKFTRSFTGAPDRYPRKGADGKRRNGQLQAASFNGAPDWYPGKGDKDQTILRFVSASFNGAPDWYPGRLTLLWARGPRIVRERARTMAKAQRHGKGFPSGGSVSGAATNCPSP